MMNKAKKNKWKILFVLINAIVLYLISRIGVVSEDKQNLMSDILSWYSIFLACFFMGYFLLIAKKVPFLVKLLSLLWVCVGIALMLMMNFGVSGLIVWLIAYVIISIVVGIVATFFYID